MYTDFFFIGALLIVTAIVGYLFTIICIPLFKRYGIVTHTDRKHPAHTHTGIRIPRGGGIPIYITIMLVSCVFLPHNIIIKTILIAAGLLVITGIMDDIYDISPYIRFFINAIAAFIVVAAHIGIPYISNPFGTGVIDLSQWQITIGTRTIWFVADILAILWIMTLTNFVNWSKGVDGQLPGYTAVVCIVLAVLAGRFSAHMISAHDTQLFAIIVAGAFFGFLPSNFYPQKIMPGWSGGALAGFLIGVLSILAFGKLGTLTLALALPILDGIYAIGRRLYQRQSPFRGDAGHLHHLLLRNGWGRRRISIFYMGSSLVCGALALTLSTPSMKYLAFGVIALLFVIGIRALHAAKQNDTLPRSHL